MESVELETGDRAFNEAVMKVQQQFLLHRERTSSKLQKLEATIDLAKMMLEIADMKARRMDFVNSLGWKDNVKPDGTLQQPGVIPDPLHHLELRLPSFEAGSGVCEVFGIGNKTQEWPNPTEEENVDWKVEFPDIQKNKEVFKDPAPAAWETYIGEPIYDEEPGKGQECWTENEFILAALKGGDQNSSNLLQSEVCTSERLEELAKSSNIQDSQQKNAPPEDNNMLADNSKEKFEMSGHSSFVNEHDIYNKLGNLPEISMSAKESVYDLQPVLIIENVPFLELNDLKNPSSHPSGQLEWTEVGSIYAANNCDLQLRSLRTANSYDLGGLASMNNVLIFDPGGYVHNITAVNGIQGVGEESNRVVSEINHQYVDSVRAGMKVISKCMVMRQGILEMDRLMGLEDHEASRTSVTTYIFDPGG